MSDSSEVGTPSAAPTSEVAKQQQPRCLEIAKAGIKTGAQFAGFMSALMSDVVEGNISPQVTNAAVNAGGKLLKVVEMQYRYGRHPDSGRPKDLDLIGDHQQAQ